MFEELQVIVLDSRYFKDKFTERNPDETYPDEGRYVPEWNISRSMLGELTIDAAALGCNFVFHLCASGCISIGPGYCTLFDSVSDSVNSSQWVCFDSSSKHI